jgi:enoyl-CoA hydratase/carnithine racemase
MILSFLSLRPTLPRTLSRETIEIRPKPIMIWMQLRDPQWWDDRRCGGRFSLHEPDLALDRDGIPRSPLAALDLDQLAASDQQELGALTAAVAASPRLSVGFARGPPAGRLVPLLEALTCSLVPEQVGDDVPASLVAVPDVPRALSELEQAVQRCPQAAVALGLLLRQTDQLTAPAGFAAEAAVYSVLLGGREFKRWLARRGEPRAPMARSAPAVQVKRERARLEVVLDRPERRNALDAAMRTELFEALLIACLDAGIAQVSLSGTGPSFCSGGDLDEFGSATDYVAAYLVRVQHSPWRLLEEIRDRVHAHIHGATVGAGVELAAFAGRLTATPEAVLSLPEVAMGLVPGAGGTVSVTRRIGRWRAAWMMLTGARIDLATALRWGLVDALQAPV